MDKDKLIEAARGLLEAWDDDVVVFNNTKRIGTRIKALKLALEPTEAEKKAEMICFLRSCFEAWRSNGLLKHATNAEVIIKYIENSDGR